ncbi:MAG: type I DNA topoisomerase [Candidatus Margulisiibacteriota bacterium]
MPKSLVIVESPAKAKTIKKFLGNDFQVAASMGHVRDLPKYSLSVDIENDFKPTYILIKDRKKIVQNLKSLIKDVDNVYLAPDPDREGEAIAWHLSEALGIEDIARRIEFNEITKKAVQDSLNHSRDIDMNRVNAQQARRVLDRIVGYKISPLLWKKIQKGLSAGRVQSVAVRLICEREAEINAFIKEEYWTIKALLLTEKGEKFEAELKGEQNNKKEKISIHDQSTAKAIEAEVRQASFVIDYIERKEKKRHPSPPFITSTLQQEASRKLGYTAKRTMMVAQQLYEGIEVDGEQVGLITYMRTDSVRIADEALGAVRIFIQKNYGLEYLPPTVRQYKTKKSAQDAHEAVRPTSVDWSPEQLKPFLDKDQYNLYELIWKRFVASQMASAIMDTTMVDINAGRYYFRANGSVMKFTGFMSLYIEGQDQKSKTKTSDEEENDDSDKRLPLLNEGEKLSAKDIISDQHFTQPPPRYTEASLVKTLEEKGIGRPSTYASIMSAIQDRGYVNREKRTLFPTEMGMTVNEQLVKCFPQVLDVTFTAKMEDNLDSIMEGKVRWQQVLQDFYNPFAEMLQKANEDMDNLKPPDKPTDEVCEKCGKPMVIKKGRYGEFMACSGFPKCRTAKSLDTQPNTTGVKCPECGYDIVEKRSRKGKIFYGCSNYPECKYALWDKPTGEYCPNCKSFLVQKRKGIACSKCDYKKEDNET